MNINELIKSFINDIKTCFPALNLKFEIEHSEEDDTILIYHNYKNALCDLEFVEMHIKLKEKYFWNNGYNNIVFTYSYYLDQKNKQKDTIRILYKNYFDKMQNTINFYKSDKSFNNAITIMQYMELKDEWNKETLVLGASE